MTAESQTARLDADAVIGCLLGQAVGDMMGLPAENLSPRRVARLFPDLSRPRFPEGKWRTEPQPPVPLAWWAVPGRNLVFLLIVLGHLVRRCLPPY